MIKVKAGPATGRLRGLDALTRRVAQAGEEWTRAGADMIVADALALLEDGDFPETDSGELARSLQIEKMPDGYVVVSDAPHAWFVEFGTLARRSDGWLGRAANQILPDLKPLAARLLQEAVRRAVRQKNGASS